MRAEQEEMDSVFTLAFALKAIISLGEYFNDLKTHVPWLLFILYFIPEATSWPCPFFYIYIYIYPHFPITSSSRGLPVTMETSLVWSPTADYSARLSLLLLPFSRCICSFVLTIQTVA